MSTTILSFLFLLIWTTSAQDYHQNAGVLQFVNPKIGTNGIPPSYIGGMIPSVAPPFGMTRWTPQTRENFQAQCPYFDGDEYIHGFQATHQPAIWMGEGGQVVITPGVGDVVYPLFVERAHRFSKEDEVSTPYVYEVTMDAQSVEAGHNLTESIYSRVPGGGQPVPAIVSEGANGRTRRAIAPQSTKAAMKASNNTGISNVNTTIKAAMTATSHVGHLRFDWIDDQDSAQYVSPYVFIQATRQNWTGHVEIDMENQEISGSNSQRQDYALGPSRAPGFRGYFASRFSRSFSAYGVTQGPVIYEGSRSLYGQYVGAYVKFAGNERVEVRTGVSFVSVEQARKNLEMEVTGTFEEMVDEVKQAWLEKLGRVEIEGINQTSREYDQRTIWYTALFHALQYPSDFSEPLNNNGMRTYYSGYSDRTYTTTNSYYQCWSIWDTFRAEHSLITLFAPERVNSMMRTLTRIFDMAGWLPMWQNIIETNIQIATHVDAVIANALVRGFKGFDVATAWEGVKKNAYNPPLRENELLFYDREAYTPDEVRAGLSTYMSKGWVANDRWSESASRTLDYAFDDFAASIVAQYAGDDLADELRNRSQSYRNIYNAKTGFMEAKNDNGTWAGSEQGWTEGDEWIYTFSVMHDVAGLADLLGGREKMKDKLDAYFDGGHNQQTNEPSHHAPFLYAAIGYPTFSQNLTRQIAFENYNATTHGLSGGDDLGQMSTWYVFTALGFYPLNPASDEYIVASPFFEKVTIRLPAGVSTGGTGGEEHTIVISAPGAPQMPFVKGLRIDGRSISKPVLKHRQIVTASNIEFEMSADPQTWGSGEVVG